MHERHPWMAALDQGWEHYGQTPGGVVYSLNPLDQARILALGFHRLLERLTNADVPIQLLAFPRLALDADYLFRQLRPWLPEALSQDRARENHNTVADPKKVRVSKELKETAGPPIGGGPAAPSLDALERAALGRELEKMRGLLAVCQHERQTAAAERDAAAAALATAQTLHDAMHVEAQLEAESAARRDREPPGSSPGTG